MDAKREEIRLVSKRLLGNQYRLEIAVKIANAKGKAVYARQLDKGIDAGDPQVGRVLKYFEEAGLLERQPSAGGRDPLRFKPRQSVYWTMCRKLLSEIKTR